VAPKGVYKINDDILLKFCLHKWQFTIFEDIAVYGRFLSVTLRSEILHEILTLRCFAAITLTVRLCWLATNRRFSVEKWLERKIQEFWNLPKTLNKLNAIYSCSPGNDKCSGAASWFTSIYASLQSWCANDVLLFKFHTFQSILPTIFMFLHFDFWIFHFTSSRHEKHRYSTLLYILLVGIFLLFSLALLFIVKPTPVVCYLRRVGIGLAWTITLAPLLVGITRTWRMSYLDEVRFVA